MAAKVSQILEALPSLHPRMREEDWTVFSQRCTEKVLAALTHGSASYADIGRLTEVVSTSPLCVEDRQRITNMLTNVFIEQGDAGVSAGKSQRWESVVNYFPASVWESMRKGQCDSMISFQMKLGPWRPSEGTSKTIALAYLTAAQGSAFVVNTTHDSRLTIGKMFKSQFKKAVHVAGPPSHMIEKLPDTPSQLKIECEVLYGKVYALEGPVSFPFDQVAFQELVQTSRCRAERAFAMNSRFHEVALASRTRRDVFGKHAFGAPTSHMDLSTFVRATSAPVTSGTAALPLPTLPVTQAPAVPTAVSESTPTPSMAPLPPPPEPLVPLALTSTPASSFDVPAPKSVGRPSVDKATEAMLQGLDAKAKTGSVSVQKKPAMAMSSFPSSQKRASGGDASGPTPKRRLGGSAPVMNHEGSRSQYLVRSGLSGKGSSMTFRYRCRASQKTAERDAKAQVRRWCQELGFPVPSKYAQ